jgi:hypothetical protein
MTFEETHGQQKITTLIGLKKFSHVKPMEEACVELVKGAINQLIAKNQANLEL